MTPATGTNDKVRLELSWLTLSLLFILFFTMVNGFFNAVEFEYSATNPWQHTFLFYPKEGKNDLHADLIASGLSFPPYPQLNVSTWPALYARYYFQNDYMGIEGVAQKKITALGLPPITILCMLIVKRGIILMGPVAVIAIFYAITLALFWLTCSYFIKDKWKRLFAFTVLTLSYPGLAILSRGNVGALPTGLLLIFYIYLACTQQRPLLAALCLAIACDFRPNALFLAPLLLCFGFRKSLFPAAVCLGVAALVSVTCHVIDVALYPGYSFQVSQQALTNYSRLYVFGPLGDAYNNSLFGAVKALYNLGVDRPNPAFLLLVNLLVLFGCGVLILYSSLLFFTKKLSSYPFAFVLVALYVLGTSIFGSYHLIIFFAFILATGRESSLRASPAPLLLFLSALMLIPKNYFFFTENVSYEVVLNPLILFLSVSWVLCMSNESDADAAEASPHQLRI